MKHKKRIWSGVVAAALALSLAGCSIPVSASTPTPQSQSGAGRMGHRSGSDQTLNYTVADLQLLTSLAQAGYEGQTILQFDRALLDWEDEDSFHKTELALQRLDATLEETNPSYTFFTRTVTTAWKACERRHYNACGRAAAPWYSGWARLATYGDIFGDQVTLTEGHTWFDFNYTVEDPGQLTVGERDSLLHGVELGMERYLQGQSQTDLQKQEDMTKALKVELQRLLKGLTGGVTWSGECDVDYWWQQAWDGDTATPTAIVTSGTGDVVISSESKVPYPHRYTQAQYDLVAQRLNFAGHGTSSIAAFDRLVNQVFQTEDEGFWLAFELVSSLLPEGDPMYAFLWDTVHASRQEYQARAQQVYSGKTVDPRVEEHVSQELTEDVFGDRVVTGMVDASYSFTYRILDEGKLTVADRDKFLSDVRAAAAAALVQVGGPTAPTKASLQAAIETAGQNASGPAIQFTGCTVDDLQVYR